ncbi:response regulator [Paenibacillus tianjinensis]|uniref:Response regulator n=2 Tax=Paenibacillus tianjinensis TaxID=2810347 RepID=A0ABX7L4E9_9BACL|nr:response regulator [Paenibacillus tianjinensis]QSF42487.1 response regulator [Paenibacillus tianjinensis]
MKEKLGVLASAPLVPEGEIYRLIHSIKGTAGTIGLSEWSDAAEQLIGQLRDDSVRDWSDAELEVYLQPLYTLLPDDEAEADGVAEEMDIKLVEPTFHESTSSDPMKKSLIVIVDDDPGMLRVLKETLEDYGWMVLATPLPSKALEWCYDLEPDCVVLDIVLENSSGFELLDNIRSRCEERLIPTLLMSARNDKATRMRSYASGADDFISKPFELDEFAARIGRQLSRRLKLTSMLMLDELTGAYNSRFFRQELERWRSASSTTGSPLSLAVLDIDQFRKWNADGNYDEGDQLLRLFSSYIRSHLRDQDIWARERADRFLLLQPGLTEEEAEHVAQRLVQQFAGFQYQKDPQLPLAATYSAGVTAVSSGVPSEKILEQAAMAIAASKAAGGGICTRYTEDQSGIVQEQPLRLAVIDDDDLIRNLLTKQLSDLSGNHNMEIRKFKDGEEFFSDPWHSMGGRYLLVLDRMMPRMNGMEVLRKLRSGAGRGEYTILMLTGVNEEREIAEAIQAGTDDYLTKPFSLVELEARVVRLLRGKK